MIGHMVDVFALRPSVDDRRMDCIVCSDDVCYPSKVLGLEAGDEVVVGRRFLKRHEAGVLNSIERVGRDEVTAAVELGSFFGWG